MERQTDSRAPRPKEAATRQPAPAHLGDMLDSLSDGFMSIDRSWRFTYLNHTAERYLQQKREDLLGRDIWQCYPDLVDSGYYRIYQQTAATGLPARHTDYYAPLDTWFEARSFAHDDGITVLFRDVTRERKHASQLEFEASHDYLTGLANRRKCMEALSQAVAAAASSGTARRASLAVLFIDLDHFKEVNDAFGHAVGDELLRGIAKRLLAILKPDFFAARVGGDEFVLLLRDTTASAAEAFAHAVLSDLAIPFEACGRSISLSASIGIALPGATPDSAEALLSHADTAMYAAKSSGRFQVRLYDGALDRGMRDRLALRMELREAFAANQFELHFQPQVALADGSPIGAEALLRWRHPERGLLTPHAFLDVLLDSPYEAVLVEWLLNAVCRHIRTWRRSGVFVPRISLNLSARQLLGAGLADTILRIARAHDVSPATLDIEVTEDSLVSDIEQATSVLAALKQAGIFTSLDDFGSGYSSLSYLVRLPIDALKIDKSFVRALVDCEKAPAVIRGIVGLARSLGMKTVAEGVECPSQAEELKDAGCDAIQGYLVSRPLDPDAFAEFMLRGGMEPK
ncbi:bifunctional diguanylate cyclase/phosphodiesterase [Paraburkholderia fungorum]|nr:EAL domain-containing protein [Paraburkholderia fungorum]USU14399.1 EAL domain-containing protein [Paraburkholderia fungorum]USU22347.1 EAL domain-containing protein [Paraburkholderia fungorum]USX07113.1 EAL domain-containing protein [Paraburkholderia fungorum]